MSVTKVTDAMRNVTQVDAAKITTGTIPDARIQASAVTAHVDLSSVRQDIAMLALYNAVSDNRAAYNLPYSFIDQFEDDTGTTTRTDVTNVSEYFASVYSAAADGNDANTKLLLHMDESVLADSSTSTQTISLTGDPARSTTRAKFGTYSCYFDGNDKLTVGHQDMGATDAVWTIDYWFNFVGVGDNQYFFWGTSDLFQGMRFSMPAGYEDKMQWYLGPGSGDWTISHAAPGSQNGILGSKTSWVADTWYHHAHTYDGTTYKSYVDGVEDMSLASSTQIGSGLTTMFVGGTSASYFTGYIDEFRISDVVSWSSAFTPPTTAYTAATSVASATGTLISDTQTAPTATTKMSGVILYKDNAGTATLGTDLKIYLSANNGSNWTEVPSYGAVTPLFSTGVKMVRLGEATVTSGTAPVIKAVWANQAASSKETQLHGWAMNY